MEYKRPVAANARKEDIEITVVIMAFNEVDNLESAVAEIASALEGVDVPDEIIIIDDGSSDGSGALADELQERHSNLQIVHHPDNRGLGGAYRSGFAQARGRYVMFFPADRQFPADNIPRFYELVHGVDMVLGYRPSRRTSRVGQVLSTGERAIYRVLFGPMPRFHGMIMFRRTILDEVPLESRGRGWAVLMEFILRTYRAGYRIDQVPIQIRPRASGESKVNNAATIWANLKQMVRLRLILETHR